MGNLEFGVSVNPIPLEKVFKKLYVAPTSSSSAFALAFLKVQYVSTSIIDDPLMLLHHL